MAANPTTHPTDQTLSSYGLGKLDEHSAQSVGEHLDHCSRCRQRVGSVSSDTFLGRLRAAQPNAGSPSIVGASLIDASFTLDSVNSPAAPPSADTLPPGLADHPDYRVKRELGRGGMGVVYLAHNMLMGRDEVLKIMGREIMEKPGVLDRFQREIRSVAGLRHPNIVTAHHAFRIEGGLVFAMEYVDGLDLARLVKVRGPLSVPHAAYFAHQAALGLQHAHERGTVHRDVKPHNLMLTHDGKARLIKVLDFGLAKATREQTVDSSLTHEGQALGTPDYIAPEQILNAVGVDIRADLYSLGGTLYFLLTGRPPFKASSLYDMYQAHISRDAEPLNLIRPEVPSELAALVSKLMAKDPRRRFQTPAEAAEALKPFFKKGPAPLIEKKPAPKVKPAPAPAPVAQPAPRPKSNPTRKESPPPPSPPPEQAPRPPAPEPVRWDRLIAIRDDGPLSPVSAPKPPLELPAHQGFPRKPAALIGVGLLSLGLLLVLALGLIRVKTPEGTLVIDGLPDSAIVEVDGRAVTIKKTADSQPSLTLAATRHGIRITTPDGKEILSRDVLITDAGTETLHLTLEPPSPAPVPDLPLDELNQQAWSLATNRDIVHRDGARALTLATSLCDRDGHQTSMYLDTLAAALAETGQFDQAVQREFQALERLGNQTGADRYLSRLELYRSGKPYHEGDILPAPNPLLSQTASALNDQAWLLATAADASERNGQKAVEAATIACQMAAFQTASYLDTLAAAHAESGNFPEAVKWQTEAIARNPSAAAEYRSRLELYRSGKPYRQGMTLPKTSLGTPLFNGKDLSGWLQTGDKDNKWSLDPDTGDLVVTGVGDPQKRGFLVSDASYDNFRLSFQFSPSTSEYDSAIALRTTPEECNDPSTNPLRVKLFQYAQYPNLKPGFLFWTPANQPGEVLPLDHPPTIRPTGEWNDMAIELQGSNLRISLNDEDVFQVDLSTLANRPNALPGLKRSSGRIAIQAHTGTIRYRNISVKELADPVTARAETPAPAPDSAQPIPLFNGKDLSGWLQAGDKDNKWSLDPDTGDLVVVATDDWKKLGFLYSEAEYRNFRLTFQFSSTSPAIHAAVAFHSLPLEFDAGVYSPIRVKIMQYPTIPGTHTGGVYWTTTAGTEEKLLPKQPPKLKPPGGWNDMRIELVDSILRVSVNNEDVLREDLSTLASKPNIHPSATRSSGRIGIQAHTGTILYRNMRILELDANGRPLAGSTPSAILTPKVPYPPDSKVFQGKHYKVFPQELTWRQASIECLRIGGHLPIVHNQAQNQFLNSLVSSANLDSAWLGATDEQEEGRWLWIDGTPMQYQAWDTAAHQPNNHYPSGEVEHYLLLIASRGGHWWDLRDNAAPQFHPGFICQWE